MMKVVYYNSFYWQNWKKWYLNIIYHILIYTWLIKYFPTKTYISDFLKDRNEDIIWVSEVMSHQKFLYNSWAKKNWYTMYETTWERVGFTRNKSHLLVLVKLNINHTQISFSLPTRDISGWWSWWILINISWLHIYVVHLSNRHRWKEANTLFSKQVEYIIKHVDNLSKSTPLIIMWDYNMDSTDINTYLLSKLPLCKHIKTTDPTRFIQFFWCMYWHVLDHYIVRNISIYTMYTKTYASDHKMIALHFSPP